MNALQIALTGRARVPTLRGEEGFYAPILK
jgi:hypothetical protein